jgi:hypothetical protein
MGFLFAMVTSRPPVRMEQSYGAAHQLLRHAYDKVHSVWESQSATLPSVGQSTIKSEIRV